MNFSVYANTFSEIVKSVVLISAKSLFKSNWKVNLYIPYLLKSATRLRSLELFWEELSTKKCCWYAFKCMLISAEIWGKKSWEIFSGLSRLFRSPILNFKIFDHLLIICQWFICLIFYICLVVFTCPTRFPPTPTSLSSLQN